MVNWAFFPRSDRPTAMVRAVVDVFDGAHPSIRSAQHKLHSDEVLAFVAPGLTALGFKVETGKKAGQKVTVPVLYANNGKVDKAFEADAHHVAECFVLEVEAGRAVMNHQFLKDLFQACMMDDIEYLGISVRDIYAGSPDFEKVVTFFDTLYASRRLQLPLKGILIIGY